MLMKKLKKPDLHPVVSNALEAACETVMKKEKLFRKNESSYVEHVITVK